MNKEYYLKNCLKTVEFTIERKNENSVVISSLQFPEATATGNTLDEAVDKLKEKIYEVDPFFSSF